MDDIADSARLAKEILDNPMFNKTISDLKQDIINKWASSDSFDKEGREAAFVYFRAIDMVHSKLSGYVNKHIADAYNAELKASVDEYSIA